MASIPVVAQLDIPLQVQCQCRCGLEASADLAARALLTSAENGKAEYYVSDSTESFMALAEAFLGEYAGGECRQIHIDAFEAPAT